MTAISLTLPRWLTKGNRERFLDYVLDREDVKGVWKRFTHHPFAQGLGDGTLPLDIFKRYLIQDYHYLVHFARSHALAAYKSKRLEDIAASSSIVLHIQTEMNLHLDYCQSFGVSKTEIESHKESLGKDRSAEARISKLINSNSMCSLQSVHP